MPSMHMYHFRDINNLKSAHFLGSLCILLVPFLGHTFYFFSPPYLITILASHILSHSQYNLENNDGSWLY